MKLVQFVDPTEGNQSQHLGLVQGEEIIDLTQTADAPSSVYDIYYRAGGERDGFETVVRRISSTAGRARRLQLSAMLANRDPSLPYLIKPVSGPYDNAHALRVWLAGVTHADSAMLREIEAKQATGGSVNVYAQKYRECAQGGRPELFSKVEPDTVIGPGQDLTRPADSQRLVPETELVSIYAVRENGQLERLGYTGGNDVTDNGIEADNPLNLPQAKNWAGGCASLGPILVTAGEFDDREVSVSCEILRNEQRVGFKQGKTGRNHLNMPDGLYSMERALFSRMPLNRGQIQALYWGTPIVFAEKDLKDGVLVGDLLRLSFSGGIGMLENPVVALPQTDQFNSLKQ